MKRVDKIYAVIVAAGSGKRLKSLVPKQYLHIADREILLYSLEKLLLHSKVVKTLVVIAKKDEKLYKAALKKLPNSLKNKLISPVFGGRERQQSVLSGLKALQKETTDKETLSFVLIHDGARPFIDNATIDNVIAELGKNSAVIPVTPIADTIKELSDGLVTKTLPREKLVTVQTPQGFNFSEILNLHEKYSCQNFSDDAALFEAAGKPVKTVAGNSKNIKITTIEDLRMAELALRKNYETRNFETRAGIGFDVHAFGQEKNKNSYVILGGIKIPHPQKLIGHSDADVAIHAIVDAILGSIGAGDIGRIFPPSEKKWQGAASKIFLKHARNLMAEKNGAIVNIDLTIICEEPKITPYAKEMRENIAAILKIDSNRVNIKATTTEKLGFTGRKEGVAAQAIATIKLPI